MSLEAIHAAVPHRKPMLLIDEIVEQHEAEIVCRKTFRQDEWFFAGHYPTFPIAPGVLLCEAAMQAGAILLAQCEPPVEGGIPVAAGMNNVRFRRINTPDSSNALSSAHARGAQFAIVDGSVRFISQNADGVTIDRIADRADGAPVTWE